MAQLRALERRTRTSGKDQVDHMPGGQDDVANAAAGRKMDDWKIRWIDLNTGCIMDDNAGQDGESPSPPEILTLNDEAFIIKYLAHVRKYGMIDEAAKRLGMDPALIKTWVQREGRNLEIILQSRRDEIRGVYDSLA